MNFPKKIRAFIKKPWFLIPVFLTIITAIIATIIKIFYPRFSVIPLMIIGYLCSLSTIYLYKGFYGKKILRTQETREVQEAEVEEAEAPQDKLSKIKESFDKVYSLSEKSYQEIGTIFHTLDHISEPVNEQAEELQVISNKINELSNYMDNIHNNYNNIINNAESINILRNSGLESVKHLQEKINTTSAVFDEIFNAFHNFTNFSNINDFINIINNIGKQTNLLALNASIEVSRAGVSGEASWLLPMNLKKWPARQNNILQISGSTGRNQSTLPAHQRKK